MSEHVILSSNDRNWRSPEDYPDPKNTTADRWAFEFVSRNNKFGEELGAAISEEQQIMAGKGEPVREGEQRPVMRVFRRWGIERPNLKSWGFDSPVKFATFPRMPPVANYGDVLCYVARSDEGRLTLEFDLSMPIKPQIKRAEELLKINQESFSGKKQKRGANITELFPYYLRTLDALAENAGKREIEEVFRREYSRNFDDRRLRNWKREAERLRDGGYKDIPLK